MAYELLSPQGHRFPLSAEWTKLGSAKDNTFIIPDPSVAPYHLSFYIKDTQVILENISGKADLIINGSPVKEAVSLKSGDVIRFAKFEFTLVRKGEAITKNKPINTPSTSVPSWRSHQNDNAGSDNRKTMRLALIAIGVLIFGYLLINDKDKSADRNPASIVDGVETTKALNSESIKPVKATPKNLSEVQAEARFREAMRDYSNNNFSRAILGFEDTLTLNPSHAGAIDYLEYATKKQEEKLKDLIKDAERSFQLLQYSRVRSRTNEILSILVEQIPGQGRRIASEVLAANSQESRISDQELNLLKIPCEKSKQKDICLRAVDLLKQARVQSGEEETLR